MTLVRISKTWDFPDIFRQTPDGAGRWDGIQFTTDDVDEADYVVVLTSPRNVFRVSCAPTRVWAIMLEPPDEEHILIHKGDQSFHRIYTQDAMLTGSRYIQSHPALPWFVNRTYDELMKITPMVKDKCLSWVTSTKAKTLGHQKRMAFLEKVRASTPCDFFGRGLKPIEDKWDGLAPYRYSIAIENFSNPYYWTEKIADCFLSWTMPIYHGCSKITEYFPAGSMACIDINHPDAVKEVQSIIQSDLRERNLEAIGEARKLVLQNYQLFPFLADEIRKFEKQETFVPAKKHVIVGAAPLYLPLRSRIPKIITRSCRAILKSWKNEWKKKWKVFQ